MEQKSLNSCNNKMQLGKSQEFYLQIHGAGGGGGDQEHTPAESNDLLEMAGNQTESLCLWSRMYPGIGEKSGNLDWDKAFQ